MSQQNFNIVFLGAQAEYFVVASDFKGFTLKLDVEASIFLTVLSKIVGSMKQLQSFLPGLGLISTQLTSQDIHDSKRQFFVHSCKLTPRSDR